MKLNEFEDKQIRQINKLDKQLNEGSLGNALLRLMFGSKFKKIMKKAVKQEDDFPEYQAALADLDAGAERLEKLAARLAKSQKALDKANRKR
ncbi:MAG TPA: hypothetical protein DCM40_36615 [Maribacter sp.]|nr:hypothetical protein [Maribacter sp.]